MLAVPLFVVRPAAPPGFVAPPNGPRPADVAIPRGVLGPYRQLVSFLAPTLFGLFVALSGTPRAGIAGILAVLALGLLTLAPVAAPRRTSPPSPG